MWKHIRNFATVMAILTPHRFWRYRIYVTAFLLMMAFPAMAERADSIRRMGLSLEFVPGRVINMDKYQTKYMKTHDNYSMALKFNFVSLPSDSNAYAAKFGYPELGAGIRFCYNNKVTMHRGLDPDWGQALPVDYDSHLGNTITAYGSFSRAFFRSRRWETSYSFDFGVGYSHRKYNRHNSIDNDLVGSRWLIYFGAGLYATYHISNDWGVKAGVSYYHHSNGALNRPNKGSNMVGPSVALCYTPYYKELVQNRKSFRPAAFEKFWYCDVALGIGAKTMNEDWLKTQYNIAPEDKDYRTDKFRLYAAYSLQTDIMYRYEYRYASGIGLDLFYGTYADHVKELDQKDGFTCKHSPWSFGVAAKHQVFYHNISLAMALGVYLHREMGNNAKEIEKPYYERIGIHYSIPQLHGLTVGCNVKAHLTKADLTEQVISYPIRLTKAKGSTQ